MLVFPSRLTLTDTVSTVCDVKRARALRGNDSADIAVARVLTPECRIESTLHGIRLRLSNKHHHAAAKAAA